MTASLLEQGQPCLTFTAFRGSLSFEDEAVRFVATLKDERGYPLLLRGQLRLADAAQAQTAKN